MNSNKSTKEVHMEKKKRGMVFIPYDYDAAFNKSVEDLHEFFVEQMLQYRFKCVYALKEITAGKQFDIEIYPEFTKMDDVPEEGKLKRDNSKAQKNLNSKNASKHLVRLINANFGVDDIWITLTYSDGQEPKDMDEAIRNMQNYINRVNYQRKKMGMPKAKYIYVTEHSPDAKIRWHHHLIMDGLLNRETVEKIWKKGKRNQSRRLEPDEYGLAGMAIYVTKEKDRKKGEKRWNSSVGLKKPKERKVHSKPPEAGKGRYKPIEKYVKAMVKDREAIEEQLKKWYPNKLFVDSEVYYNDFNGLFYIRARMRVP